MSKGIVNLYRYIPIIHSNYSGYLKALGNPRHKITTLTRTYQLQNLPKETGERDECRLWLMNDTLDFLDISKMPVARSTKLEDQNRGLNWRDG